MRSARYRGLVRGASRALDLPDEVILDLPKITVIAGIQVIVENHRGVIEYRPTCLRIRIRNGEVKVEGKSLSIGAINNTEIVIDGTIWVIAFPTTGVTAGVDS